MQFDISRYLQLLGFPLNGKPPSLSEIKQRWKELCRKHHPDTGGDKDAFIRITHAYDMLTNAAYRHKHLVDEARKKSHNSFGDLNIRIQVPIAFDMAFFGQKIIVSWNRLEFDEKLKPITGKPYESVSETVDIPVGSMGGFEKEVLGGGHRLAETCGNATLLGMVMPHQKFQVHGSNVVAREAIPLDILLRGGSVEIATMYGIKTLRVPPGTKPGSELSIKGFGVGAAGRHVVQAEALFPSREDLKTKDEWRGLGIDWENESAEDEEEQMIRNLFLKFGGSTLRVDHTGAT